MGALLAATVPARAGGNWDGGGGDDVWGTGGNWDFDTSPTPSTSTDINFTDWGAAGRNPWYNYGDWDDFRQISFLSSVVGSKRVRNTAGKLDVFGDFYQSDTDPQAWEPTLSFTGSSARDYTVDASGGDLDLDCDNIYLSSGNSRFLYLKSSSSKNIYIRAVIANGSGVSGNGVTLGTIDGSAGPTVYYKGANTYDGETRINYGALILDSSAGDERISDSSGLYVNTNGTFNKNGKTETVRYVEGFGSILLGSTANLIYTGNDSKTYAGTFTGSGTAALVKKGTGAWTLSGNSTAFTGTVYVVNGMLVLTNNNAGSKEGNLYLGETTGSDGAEIQVASGITISRPITIRDGSSGTKTISGAGTISGNITNAENDGSAKVSFTNASSEKLTVSGVISVNGFTKSGAGTLTLAGANTFTGDVAITGGTLEATNMLGGGTGSTTASGTGSVVQIRKTNILGGNHNSEYGRTLVATNGGTILISEGVNRVGNVKLYGGSITANVSDANFGGFFFGPVGGQDGTVTVGGAAASAISGSGNLTLGTGTVFNVADCTGDADADLTVGVPLANVHVSASLLSGLKKSGPGTMLLGAVNTYTGSTTVSAGTLTISGSGSLGSGSYAGAITNNGTLNYFSSASQTLSGNISGSGALAKSNTSTLILTGTNTYSGTTTISAGTLQVGNGGASGSLGSGAVADNGRLVYSIAGGTGNAAPAFTLVNISGTGSLTGTAVTGNIALNSDITLGGSQTYVTRAGQHYEALRITANRILTASAISITGHVGNINSGGTTLTLDTSAANGPISLNLQSGMSGSLWAVGIRANAGTGTVTLSGGNAATSGWNDSSGNSLRGALSISSSFSVSGLSLTATAASVVSGNLTLSSAANIFACDPGVTNTISGTLSSSASGGANITKSGAGTLVLSGNNTYTGTTAILAGKLLAIAGGSCSNSAVTVASGATVGVRVLTSGARWACGNLILSNGTATAEFDYAASPSMTVAPMLINGSLTNNGTLNVVIPRGMFFSGMTYPLIQYTNSLAVGTLGTVTLPLGAVGTLVNNTANKTIDLNVTTGLELLWSAGSGAWDISTSTNWNSQTEVYTEGRGVKFDDSASGSGPFSVTMTNALNPDGVLVSNTLKAYTFGGSAISGATTVIKMGTNTLVVTNANTYGGITTISAGTLQVGNGGATGSLGTNTIVVNGNLMYSLSSQFTLPSNLSGTGNLSVTASGPVFFGGSIALGGSQTYSTPASFSHNCLRMEGADRTLTASSITITGYVGAFSDGGRTLTLNTSGANGPISLNLQNGAGGWEFAVRIIADAGTGMLAVAGGNAAYGGGWGSTLGNSLKGALNISSSFGVSTLSLTATAASAVSGNLALGSAANNTFACDPGVTNLVSGNLSGAGSITKAGLGTLVLSGTNVYSGSSTISGGTLALSGVIASNYQVYVSGSGSPVLDIAGGSLTSAFANARSIVIGNGAGQGGMISVSGAGSLSVPGLYIGEDAGGTGALSQAGGAVAVGASELWMAGNRSTLTVTGGTFSASGTTRIGIGLGGISTSEITASGAGAITLGNLQYGLSPRNGFTATVNVGNGSPGGTLQVNNLFTSGTGTRTLNFNGGTFVANGTFSVPTEIATVVQSGGAIISTPGANVLSIPTALANGGGGGGLTKTGSGTLTLSGTNTFAGPTTISAGALTVSGSGSLGAGSYAGAITNSGVLNYSSSSNQALSGTISGTGSLTKTSASTLVLSGANNSYGGGTLISGGILQMGAGGTNGALGTGWVTNNGTLCFNRGDDITQGVHFVGSLVGTGSVSQISTGTVVLAGANTYRGTTTVGAGKLVTTTDSTGGGSYVVSNTAWLVVDLKAVDAQLRAGSAFTLGDSTLEFSGSVTSETVAASTTAVLTVNGNVILQVPTNLLGLADFKEYPLIKYTSRAGAGDFTLGTTPGAGVAASIEDTGTSIVLRVNSSEPIEWNGDVNAAWDTLVANWKQKTGGAPGRKFGKGVSVEFNDTLTANSNVSLNVVAQPSAVLFTNSAIAYTLGGTGRISGTTGLVKDGTNAVAILVTNDFTGSTVISGGVVRVSRLAGGGTNSPLGKASSAATNLVLAGGTLRYEGGTVVIDRLFGVGTAGGGIEAAGSGALKLINAGAIGFHGQSGARTLTLGGTNQNDNRLTAYLADSGGATALNKTGPGTWWLQGTNTHGGVTTVGAGVLDILTDTALGSTAGGTVVSNGATLQMEGPLNIGEEPLTLAGDGAGGVGALYSATEGNTVGGPITLSGDARIVSGTAGSTLRLTGTGVVASAGYMLTMAGAGNAVIEGGIGPGAGGLNKAGAGLLALNGVSAFAGLTAVSGGVLAVQGVLNRTGTLRVAAGATLTGTGTVGSVTVNDEGRIIPGGSTGLLRVEGLQLDYGSQLTYEFVNYVSNDLIRVAGAGALALNGGQFTLYEAGTSNRFDASGRYNLITYSNSYSGDLGNLSVANPSSSKEYFFGDHDSNITLTIRTTIGWDGSGEDLSADDLRWTLNTNWADGYIPTNYDVFVFGAATKGHFNTNDMAPNTVVGGIQFLDDASDPYVLDPLDSTRVLNLAGGITNLSPARHVINIPLAIQDGSQVIGVVSNDLELNGTISEIGTRRGLVMAGPHTLILTGTNTYSGGTQVGTGTLRVDNGGGSATGSGLADIYGTGTLTGMGRVSGLRVGGGGTLSPGLAGAATLTAGATTWDTNGAYRWEMNDFSGAHGGDPGRDHLRCTGVLTIAATAANAFKVQVSSLTYGNTSGVASNFILVNGYTQLLASATAINGFAAEKFALVLTNFHNPFVGTWNVQVVDGTNLALVYSPVITNTASTTNGLAEPSFEAGLQWAMPPNRNVQGNPSASWKSYAVFYTYDGTEPTTNSPVVVYTNGPASLTNITTTALGVTNLAFDTDIRMAAAIMDTAGRFGPISAVVTQRTADFVVTQGMVSAESGVIIRWPQRSDVAYDILYQDAASWANGLTNSWQLMATVTNGFAEDLGGGGRPPVPELGAGTTRFYRVTRRDHWQADRSPRTASREIYVARNLRLMPGENWYSLPATPDDNTVAGIFGTNRLPRNASHTLATRISWYSGGTANGAANRTAYLSNLDRWVYTQGGTGVADTDRVALVEGFVLELPGATPTGVVVVGRLTTNALGATVYGGNTFNLLSYAAPARPRVRDLRLREAGFRGAAAYNQFTLPDELRILNNANGNGSMTSPRLRIWLKITATETNYYHVTGGTANNVTLEPDEVLIWWNRGAGDQAWSYTPTNFYRVPTPTMTP